MAATPRASRDGSAASEVEHVDLDWHSVLVVCGAFVALVALTGLVRSTPRTLAALAVGTLLALALNPLVSAVQRRLRSGRGAAVGVVLAGFVMAVVAVALLLVPPAIRQARELRNQLPEVVADLDRLPLIGEQLRKADAAQTVQGWVEGLPRRLAGDTTPVEKTLRSLADGLLAALFTSLVTVSLLIDGERLLLAARRLVPVGRRAQADRIGDLAYRTVGRYAAGSMLVAVIAGLAVLVVGLALGVPLTPLLAVWVALFDLVPQIGGAVGGLAFVALGFTQGPTTGVVCAVFFVLYLQFENHILSPLIVGQAVKLSPPATMTAALVGVSAGGVVGALLAVPLVGAAKVVYGELRPPKS